jgi:hypothetical protein
MDDTNPGGLEADRSDRPAAHLPVPAPDPTPEPLPNLVPGGTASQPNQEEIDHDGDSDRDSAYGESLHASDTASITTAITKYRYENGRRYHAYRDGAYWAPNDETQNDQQDMAHHLWLLTLDNKLYLAPILNPQVRSICSC